MVSAEATIRNANGIHCRPSTLIMRATKEYPGRLCLRAEDGETDLKSIYGLLFLGLEQGRKVQIEVEGPDEEEMLATLVELFERKFDFPPRSASAAAAGGASAADRTQPSEKQS